MTLDHVLNGAGVDVKIGELPVVIESAEEGRGLLVFDAGFGEVPSVGIYTNTFAYRCCGALVPIADGETTMRCQINSRPVVVLGILLMLIPGCSLVFGDQDLSEFLPGTSWQLTRMEFEYRPDWEQNNERISVIRFNEDGSLSVRANCTWCGRGGSSGYVIKGDSLTLRVGGCSEMGCVHHSKSLYYAHYLYYVHRAKVEGLNGIRLVLIATPDDSYGATKLHHVPISEFPG